MRVQVLLVLLAASACGGGRSDGASADAHHPADSAAGDSTPTVTLSEAAHSAAGILIDTTRLELPQETLEVPAQVEFDPRRVALLSARSAGRVEHLDVVAGDRVRTGQVLARLYSPAFQTAQNDFFLALRRAESLRGTPDAEGAESIVRATRRRLALLGMSQAHMTRLETAREASDFLALTAPFDGSIVEAHTLSGATVEAGTMMFRIADLSVVDAVAQVPERALPLVSVGQAATVTIEAYPDLEFAGQVERLYDELDQQTRTLGAVIHVPNPSRRLRPGMFALVRFRIDASAAGERRVTIPEASIVTDGDARYVFVEIAPRTYERRAVEVASLAPPGAAAAGGGRVVVRSGLRAGERVVVRGAFTLKSELAKAALAEDEH